MLPKRFRFWLFETLSLKTMRYVHAIPRRTATGLVAQVYDMRFGCRPPAISRMPGSRHAR
jgi:hypothetical protein